MKTYNRIMAGKQSVHAAQCFKEGFIGVDYDINVDLAGNLPEKLKDFNNVYRPVFLANRPEKSKIAAGLACGFTWTVAKGLKEGDIVITPDGNRRYFVGEIAGPYYYAPGDDLPHRRPVKWFPDPFDRDDMSEALRNSTNSTGTCCDITGYAEELKQLIGGQDGPQNPAVAEVVEDAVCFVLEKHLEDFLVSNWKQTELGKKYDIYLEEGEFVGRQYPSDTGPIDILAISKDGKELLVVELKRGRASDAVVGQIQRYMGFVLDELAEKNQSVRGIIIALEDDNRIRRALRVTQNIDFYRYQVNFTLIPTNS